MPDAGSIADEWIFPFLPMNVPLLMYLVLIPHTLPSLGSGFPKNLYQELLRPDRDRAAKICLGAEVFRNRFQEHEIFQF
jgi:hypothetical protein